MNQSGTYILVYMVEKQDAGYRFLRRRSDWPLHVTLVPWFVVTDDKTAELITKLETHAREIVPFDATVGPEIGLGASQEIPVNLITDVQPFRAMQDRLLDGVRSTYMSFMAANVFIEDQYKPHITHHKVGNEMHKVPEGTIVRVDEFSLVRLGPAQEQQACEVVRNFKLGTV
jgi:2'-5' RNA ligase